MLLSSSAEVVFISLKTQLGRWENKNHFICDYYGRYLNEFKKLKNSYPNLSGMGQTTTQKQFKSSNIVSGNNRLGLTLRIHWCFEGSLLHNCSYDGHRLSGDENIFCFKLQLGNCFSTSVLSPFGPIL